MVGLWLSNIKVIVVVVLLVSSYRIVSREGHFRDFITIFII